MLLAERGLRGSRMTSGLGDARADGRHRECNLPPFPIDTNELATSRNRSDALAHVDLDRLDLAVGLEPCLAQLAADAALLDTA